LALVKRLLHVRSERREFRGGKEPMGIQGTRVQGTASDCQRQCGEPFRSSADEKRRKSQERLPGAGKFDSEFLFAHVPEERLLTIAGNIVSAKSIVVAIVIALLVIAGLLYLDSVLDVDILDSALVLVGAVMLFIGIRNAIREKKEKGTD